MIKILSIFVFLSLKLFAAQELNKEMNFNEFLNKALQNNPLSVVITGEIISSTLLTLLILPSTYLLLYKTKHSE